MPAKAILKIDTGIVIYMLRCNECGYAENLYTPGLANALLKGHNNQWHPEPDDASGAEPNSTDPATTANHTPSAPPPTKRTNDDDKPSNNTS